MIRLEARAGAAAGRVFEVGGEIVRLGRSADNEVVLDDACVSPQHARLLAASTGVMLEDLASERGTARLRDGERTAADEANGFRLTLRAGDLIELGRGANAAVVAVLGIADEAEANVVALEAV